MSEWQPIETAPRDGTPFLAWDAGDTFQAGCVCFAEFWDADDEGNEAEFVIISNANGECNEPPEFTHWMPLPNPPVQS